MLTPKSYLVFRRSDYRLGTDHHGLGDFCANWNPAQNPGTVSPRDCFDHCQRESSDFYHSHFCASPNSPDIRSSTAIHFSALKFFCQPSKCDWLRAPPIRNSCVSFVFSVSSVVKNEPRITRMNHNTALSVCCRTNHSGWSCHSESCIYGEPLFHRLRRRMQVGRKIIWQKNWERTDKVPGRAPAGCSVKIKRSGWR